MSNADETWARPRGRVDPSTPQRRGHRRGVPLRRLTAQSHPSMLGGDPRALLTRQSSVVVRLRSRYHWRLDRDGEPARNDRLVPLPTLRWRCRRPPVERETPSRTRTAHRAPHLAGSGPGGGKAGCSGRDARAHTPFSTIARPPSTSASPPTPRPHRSDRRDEASSHCLPCCCSSRSAICCPRRCRRPDGE